MPKVYNRRHHNTPPGAKYVGRGTPYGNRFIIGIHGNRDEVCDLFEKEQLPHLDIEPLRGYDIECWCDPERCHGHSIARKLYGPDWTNE